MKCKHVREMMGAYLYSDLAPEEMRRLREHVERCAECREDLHGRGTVAASLDDTAGTLTDQDRQEITWSVKGAVRAKQRQSRPLALRLAPTFGVAVVLLLGFAIGFVISSQRVTPVGDSVRATTGDGSQRPKVNVVEKHKTPADNNPEVSALERTVSTTIERVRPSRPRRARSYPRYPITPVSVGRREQDNRSQMGAVDAPLPVLVDYEEGERGSELSNGKLPRPIDLGSADAVPAPEE